MPGDTPGGPSSIKPSLPSAMLSPTTSLASDNSLRSLPIFIIKVSLLRSLENQLSKKRTATSKQLSRLRARLLHLIHHSNRQHHPNYMNNSASQSHTPMLDLTHQVISLLAKLLSRVNDPVYILLRLISWAAFTFVYPVAGLLPLIIFGGCISRSLASY